MNESFTVVFVCEHGAAKSVIAAAFFNQLAKQKGLNLQAIPRGTHPDEALSANTIKGLAEDGVILPVSAPEKLFPADLKTGKMVISFCSLSDEEVDLANKVEYWDGVPPVSENYQAARDAILNHMNGLLKRLADHDE